jgi:hypothetical protein
MSIAFLFQLSAGLPLQAWMPRCALLALFAKAIDPSLMKSSGQFGVREQPTAVPAARGSASAKHTSIHCWTNPRKTAYTTCGRMSVTHSTHVTALHNL